MISFKDILGRISQDQKSSSNCEDQNTVFPGFEGFEPCTTIFRADLHRGSSEPSLDIGEILKDGYRVRFMKGIKKITIFRFLLAKLLYEEEGLHLDEYIVMYELYYSLSGSTDPSFIQKYKNWFKRTIPMFESVARATSFPVRLKKQSHTEQAYQEFLSPLIPTRRGYYGLKGQRDLRKSWSLKLNSALPVQKIPPKAYVGVGYRDKGSRKDVAKDGSPSWQEVSSHFTELDRRLEEDRALEISKEPGHPQRE